LIAERYQRESFKEDAMMAPALKCLTVLAILSVPASAFAAYGDSRPDRAKLAGANQGVNDDVVWAMQYQPVREIAETGPCRPGAVAVFSHRTGDFWCAPVK
jgi:hypothetical protein